MKQIYFVDFLKTDGSKTNLYSIELEYYEFQKDDIKHFGLKTAKVERIRLMESGSFTSICTLYDCNGDRLVTFRFKSPNDLGVEQYVAKDAMIDFSVDIYFPILNRDYDDILSHLTAIRTRQGYK